MQPISHTHRNQPIKWSRVESSHAKPNDRSPTGSKSKRVVAGKQSPITEGRGGEGKWINRSEQVAVDDMTGIISMAKCGR